MKRLAMAVGLLLGGCDGDDGGGTGGTPIAVDDLAGRLGAATCALQFECCTAAELMEEYMGITFEGMPIETETQCVQFTTAVFTSFATTNYKISIEKGRAEYDARAAGDCVAAIEGLTCAQYSEGALPTEGTSCRPFILPRVADGGACSQDYECTSDFCEGARNPIGEEPTEGTCVTKPAQGEVCSDECADGLYCKFNPSSMNTCEPLEAEGGECNFDDECESDYCDDTGVCAVEAPTCTGL